MVSSLEKASESHACRLLVTSGVARLDPDQLQSFRDAGFDLDIRYDLSGSRDPEAVVNAATGAWGVLAGTEVYSSEVLGRLPSLRALARCGVGYDAIDVQAASERGVAIITTPGTNDSSVAEFALSLMLVLLAHVRSTSSARWSLLSGETVAVVGLGAIGLGVAARLRGFGCRVLGVDPVADLVACERLGIEVTTLESALARAGVVTLHTPLNPNTRGMLGKAEFALFGSDALLVNTSRGGVVDETALVAALRTKKLAGAALDVFEDEPLPADHALRRTPNTVLVGHIAGVTRSSVRSMLDMALAGLSDVRAGRTPVSALNSRDLVPRPGAAAVVAGEGG